jgi:hypothetical protein
MRTSSETSWLGALCAVASKEWKVETARAAMAKARFMEISWSWFILRDDQVDPRPPGRDPPRQLTNADVLEPGRLASYGMPYKSCRRYLPRSHHQRSRSRLRGEFARSPWFVQSSCCHRSTDPPPSTPWQTRHSKISPGDPRASLPLKRPGFSGGCATRRATPRAASWRPMSPSALSESEK